MADWKTKMNPIYIQDWDLYDDVCEYNTQNGENQVKTRSDAGIVGEDDTWTGFSKRFEKDVIGVFASDCGPVFFVNNSMFPLFEKTWTFDIKNISDKINAFQFVYNEKTILDFTYERWTFLGIHPYADEGFEDFFTWISEKNDIERFVQYYTRRE